MTAFAQIVTVLHLGPRRRQCAAARQWKLGVRAGVHSRGLPSYRVSYPKDQEMTDRYSLTSLSPIGAGDTFIAGMLYGLTCRDTEWGLAQKLAFATQLAGMKVSQEGFTGLHRVLVSMKCPL